MDRQRSKEVSPHPSWLGLALLPCAALAGCDYDRVPEKTLSRAELLDPQTCESCHPRHYREWKSSMHAYAAEDPVFQAMNRRGQEETHGELGDFCVRCHAPMAVIEGQTRDGLNLDQVDDKLKGVTCYFCHSAEAVEADHNNGLVLRAHGQGDTTLLGGIANPVQPRAHVAAYAQVLDGSTPDSTALCGSCHDIETPSGVHLERTFAEYKTSLFAEGAGALSCTSCHMPGRENLLAAEDPNSKVRTRTIHEHLWPAVDVALTPWPDTEGQRHAVECELANGARISSLEPAETGDFRVIIETNAGHHQPSGASQDRRLWVEFVAYDAQDQIVFQSGKVERDEIVDKAPDAPGFDPSLWLFRSRIYDERAREVHMFWQAAPSAEYPDGYTSKALLPATHADPVHHAEMTFHVPLPLPERVTVRALIQPMGLEVLDDLIASGHLDPSVRDAMPTHELRGTQAEWRRKDGFDIVVAPQAHPSCDYRCDFEPNDPSCR
jgi:hypothetical protein